MHLEFQHSWGEMGGRDRRIVQDIMHLAQRQKQQAPCVKNKVKLHGLPKANRPPDTRHGTTVPTLKPVSFKHTQNKRAYNS